MKFLLIFFLFLLLSCGTVEPEDQEIICLIVHYVNGDSVQKWFRVDLERQELYIGTARGSYWLAYRSNHANRWGAQRDVTLEVGVIRFEYCK